MIVFRDVVTGVRINIWKSVLIVARQVDDIKELVTNLGCQLRAPRLLIKTSHWGIVQV